MGSKAEFGWYICARNNIGGTALLDCTCNGHHVSPLLSIWREKIILLSTLSLPPLLSRSFSVSLFCCSRLFCLHLSCALWPYHPSSCLMLSCLSCLHACLCKMIIQGLHAYFCCWYAWIPSQELAEKLYKAKCDWLPGPQTRSETWLFSLSNCAFLSLIRGRSGWSPLCRLIC